MDILTNAGGYTLPLHWKRKSLFVSWNDVSSKVSLLVQHILQLIIPIFHVTAKFFLKVS